MNAVYLILRCPVCGVLTPWTWRVESGEPMLPSLCDGYEASRISQSEQSHPPTVQEVAFIERVEVSL